MPVERKAIQLRLPAHLALTVTKMAEAENRSVNNWIEQVLFDKVIPIVDDDARQGRTPITLRPDLSSSDLDSGLRALGSAWRGEVDTIPAPLQLPKNMPTDPPPPPKMVTLQQAVGDAVDREIKNRAGRKRDVDPIPKKKAK